MNKKTNREIREEEEAEKARNAAVAKQANRKTLVTIGAIIAGGLALALWMTSGPGTAPSSEAQAQRAGSKAQIPEDELMKPGPLPENVLGNTNAKVTIVEYASMTCPACAHFHKTIYPELKKKYVETGKVRLVLREYPRDNRDAAAWMLARCAGPDKYFGLVDILFSRQEQWAFAPRDAAAAKAELLGIVRQAGMTEEAFTACVEDKKTLTAIEQIRNQGAEKFGVSSTPTFFVNGKKLTGVQDISAFEKAIEPLLK